MNAKLGKSTKLLYLFFEFVPQFLIKLNLKLLLNIFTNKIFYFLFSGKFLNFLTEMKSKNYCEGK